MKWAELKTQRDCFKPKALRALQIAAVPTPGIPKCVLPLLISLAIILSHA